MKVCKKKVVIYCLSVVLYSMLFSCGYAFHNEAPVDKEIKEYCNFEGISKDRIKDFSMLEEEANDTPNFKAMRKHLSVFIRIPKEIINNCPVLKGYLLELIEYVNSPANINNEKITENTKGIISYISQKLVIK